MAAEVRCGHCGALYPDVHTLLCEHCFCRLPPVDRWRAERDAVAAALIYESLVESPMGAVRWTPQQYVEYMQRRGQEPEPRKPRAPATPRPPDSLVFELPLTPTGNTWQRMHYHARGRVVRKVAEQLALQIPMASGIPYRAARVEVVRYSSKKPDPDGFGTSFKPVLDALQLRSKRHPYGVGVIVDDDSDHIDFVPRWERSPPNKGKVVVIVTRKA